MNQILNTDNAKFAQILLNDLVVGERYPLFVDLSVSALVDKVTDRFYVWEAIRDIRFDYFEHFGGGFGEFDEDAVVDLEET